MTGEIIGGEALFEIKGKLLTALHRKLAIGWFGVGESLFYLEQTS